MFLSLNLYRHNPYRLFILEYVGTKESRQQHEGRAGGIWSGHGAGQTQTSVPSSTCKSCCVTQNIITKVIFLPRRFMLSFTSTSPGPAVWLNFTIPFQKCRSLPFIPKFQKRYANHSCSSPSTSKEGNLPNAAECFLFPPDCRLWQEPGNHYN